MEIAKMITVYTKPSCVQCDATKRMMDKLKISYLTVDITTDTEAFEMLMSKGFKSAPVVITDTEAWSGFNPDKISELAD
jgi:glutaredoxin-like protein NrdH